MNTESFLDLTNAKPIREVIFSEVQCTLFLNVLFEETLEQKIV